MRTVVVLMFSVCLWHLGKAVSKEGAFGLADKAVYPGLGSALEARNDGSLHIAEAPTELSKYLTILSKGDPADLTRYALDSPKSPFADDALLEAGIMMAGRGDLGGARKLLDKLWREYPEAVRLDQTYREFQGRGKIYPEESRRYERYQEYMLQHPNRSADVAMVELGTVYIESEDLDSAQAVLNRVVDRYPNGQHAAEDKKADICVYYDPHRPLGRALWLLAEINRRRDEAQGRRDLLNRAVELYPSSTIGLKCLDALAEDQVDQGHDAAAKKILSRKLDTLRKLADAAKREGLLLRAFEFGSEERKMQAP